MIAFARGRRVCVCVCVCVHDRALHERLVCVRACVRAVCVFSRACVRGRRVCAFTRVRCIDVLCACAVTSLVRAQPSSVCVYESACAAVVCAHSRACVCVDVSCACAPCASCHERYGPSVFPAAKLIKYMYILILISINMHILIYN